METTTLTSGQTTIILIGTSHISPDAPATIKETIDKHQPDHVCVELDEARLNALQDSRTWENTNIMQAIQDGNGYMLLAQTLLGIYQRQLGRTVDIEPGTDMLTAHDHATANNIPVSLIDRDINETFSRVFDQLSFTEKAQLAADLLFGESDQDIPTEPSQEFVEEAIAALGDRYPALRNAVIDERDAIMAERIQAIDAETIVAVLGAGHVDGIVSHLSDQHDSPVPQTSSSGIGTLLYHGVKYGLPIAIIGMFLYGTIGPGAGSGGTMASYWIVLNAIGAGIGAIASRAHPVTIVIAAAAAPFTSINPALPAGLVAAWIENYMRPPQVSDITGLHKLSDISEIWSNRATRLLLIFMLVNLGSAIATFLGTGALLSLIF